MKNFLSGVEILSKHQEPEERWGISAEHDIIYTCFKINPNVMSKEDYKALEDLGGWYWDTEYECWAFFT